MATTDNGNIKTLEITIQRFYLNLCKKNNWQGEEDDFFYELANLTKDKLSIEGIDPNSYIITASKDSKSAVHALQRLQIMDEAKELQGKYDPQRHAGNDMTNTAYNIKAAYHKKPLGNTFTVYGYDSGKISPENLGDLPTVVINYKLSS